METVIRVFLLYLFIIVGLRILGKREFSQMSPIELVTLMLIPDILSQSLVHDDFSLTNGIVAITTLFSLTFITSLLAHRSKRAERLIGGVPVILVQDGTLIEGAMNRERVSVDELYAQLHQNGLQMLAQVRWAILETDGRIAIVPKDDADSQPNTDDGNEAAH
jgi:uncharacterized membrane protein YcaP (DUF421 family)